MNKFLYIHVKKVISSGGSNSVPRSPLFEFGKFQVPGTLRGTNASGQFEHSNCDSSMTIGYSVCNS